MTNTSTTNTETMVSKEKSRWLPCGILGAVSALVIGLYAVGAQSGSLELLSRNPADTYYNLLVHGFRAGQLSLKKDAPPGLAQLADPYDPVANARFRPSSDPLVDMSYYRGRLYLYFGVTPAVILFWPFAAATGHYLLHRQAVAIFCSIGFLASVGLLCGLWRRYFTEVNVGVVVLCVLALGMATGIPVLLTRSEVYEVPISCGYMLTMLALGAVWKALHDAEPRKRSGWLAAASLACGLAVGARPSLMFGAAMLFVPVMQAWYDRKSVRALLIAATGPMTFIGLGLMLYNALRFGNPFEFGLRYELGPARMDTLQFFSLPYLWFNVRVYFLEPAGWGGCFPFVHQIVVPPLPSGRGQIETPFGMLINMPLVWLALAVPLAWRGRPATEDSVLRWFIAAVALVFGIDALVLCLFRGANFRYEVEFLPALVMLALVGIFGLERALAGQPVWRRAARCGWGLLLGFTLVFNLLVAAVNCAEAQNYAGNALLQAGRYQQAIGHYELALWFKPDLAEAPNNLGSALLNLGKVTEAMDRFKQALRIKPDYAEAYYNLGVASEQAGRIEDAVANYEQALRIKPEFPEAHHYLGDQLHRLGRTQEAIGHYEQALRIRPAFAEVHNNLGTVLELLGRTQEAIGHFEQALLTKPDSAEFHVNLGLALEQAGRVQEAIGHYQQALRLKPDLAAAQNALARLRAVQ